MALSILCGAQQTLFYRTAANEASGMAGMLARSRMSAVARRAIEIMVMAISSGEKLRTVVTCDHASAVIWHQANWVCWKSIADVSILLVAETPQLRCCTMRGTWCPNETQRQWYVIVYILSGGSNNNIIIMAIK